MAVKDNKLKKREKPIKIWNSLLRFQHTKQSKEEIRKNRGTNKQKQLLYSMS